MKTMFVVFVLLLLCSNFAQADALLDRAKLDHEGKMRQASDQFEQVTSRYKKEMVIQYRNAIKRAMNAGDLATAKQLDVELREFIGEQDRDAAGGGGDNKILRSVSLTKIEPETATVGAGAYKINEALENRQVVIDGKVCKSFICAHANSVIKYKVPRGCNQFSAVGCVTFGDKTVRFLVRGAGVTILETKPLCEYQTGTISMCVKIPIGVKEIELVTDCCGDNVNDHAIWAYPQFEVVVVPYGIQ